MELTTASIDDAEEIIKVIDDAYEIESGSSEVAFTTTRRFASPTDAPLLKGYEENRIFKVVETGTGKIVGATYWELTEHKTVYFGPYAVSPVYQGRGIGRMMMEEVERIARENEAIGIDIKVVNARIDLIDWYKSQGYEEVGISYFTAGKEKNHTKPVHFIEMRRMFDADNFQDRATGYELRTAHLADAEAIKKVINDAYDITVGTTGFGFKKEVRLVDATEGNMLTGYVEGRIVKAVERISGKIVGVIYWELSDHNTIYFGPFAVSPDCQGRGIGRMLLVDVERIARERDLAGIDVHVVNIRTDLISLYRKYGYEQVGVAPFPSEYTYKLTRTDIDVVQMRKLFLPADRRDECLIKGGCYCGKIRYVVSSMPCHVYFCHCSICRRISGSVVMAWLTVPIHALQFIDSALEDKVRWQNINFKPSELGRCCTTENFERFFCTTCGSHILFKGTKDPKYVELCHGSLDKPDQMIPQNHIWTENQLPFLHLNCDLPGYRTEPNISNT